MKFADLITHQLDNEARAEVLDIEQARARVTELIDESRFFTVEPMPDGEYEIVVKTEPS